MHRRVIDGLKGGLLLALLALLGQLSARPTTIGTDPAACARCHPAEVAAWASSRHAAAFTNTAFQVSWQRTQSPWCADCHSDASPEHGIACASCHGSGDMLTGSHPSVLARAAHPIRHDDALTDERACARCHQFSLPSPGALTANLHPMPLAPTPSQDTVTEWRASAAAARGITCTGCHDQHASPGAHDHDFVREAIEVEARYDGTRVLATLQARDAAHAVPTGDPFRRLEFAICGPGPCDEPLASATLERVRRAEGNDWIIDSDTRIPTARSGAERSEVSLVLTPDSPLPPGARWRLVYRFSERILEPQLSRSDRYFIIAKGSLLPGGDVL